MLLESDLKMNDDVHGDFDQHIDVIHVVSSYKQPRAV